MRLRECATPRFYASSHSPPCPPHWHQVVEEAQAPLSTFYRHISKGAWPFSTRDHGWPISDCSSEGLKAALTLANLPKDKVCVYGFTRGIARSLLLLCLCCGRAALEQRAQGWKGGGAALHLGNLRLPPVLYICTHSSPTIAPLPASPVHSRLLTQPGAPLLKHLLPPFPYTPLQVGASISDQRLYECVNVILSYQNFDGGMATYENTRSFHWLEVRGVISQLQHSQTHAIPASIGGVWRHHGGPLSAWLLQELARYTSHTRACLPMPPTSPCST